MADLYEHGYGNLDLTIRTSWRGGYPVTIQQASVRQFVKSSGEGDYWHRLSAVSSESCLCVLYRQILSLKHNSCNHTCYFDWVWNTVSLSSWNNLDCWWYLSCNVDISWLCRHIYRYPSYQNARCHNSEEKVWIFSAVLKKVMRLQCCHINYELTEANKNSTSRSFIISAWTSYACM